MGRVTAQGALAPPHPGSPPHLAPSPLPGWPGGLLGALAPRVPSGLSSPSLRVSATDQGWGLAQSPTCPLGPEPRALRAPCSGPMCPSPGPHATAQTHRHTQAPVPAAKHPALGRVNMFAEEANRPVSQEKNVAKPDPGGRGPHSHYHPESRRPLKSAGKPLTAPCSCGSQHPREPGWGAAACPMGGGCRCGIRAHSRQGGPVSRSPIHCRRADSWGLWGLGVAPSASEIA